MAKKKEETPQPKKLRITLVKSPIGYSQRHKATIDTLGLKRMNYQATHVDTPSLRGMLRKVAHLVTVEEVEDKG